MCSAGRAGLEELDLTVPGTLRLPAAAARLPGLRRLALTGEQVAKLSFLAPLERCWVSSVGIAVL